MVKKTFNKLTAELKEELRNKFVQGIEDNTGGRKLFSLDQLAADYNVSLSTLYKHAQKDSWKEQQKNFQQEFLVELDAKRRKELAQESVTFDRTSLNIAKSLMGLVGKGIAQNAKQDVEIKPQNIVALSHAASNAQRVAKLALGEATENMNLDADVKQSQAFREALSILDEVAEQIRTGDASSLH